MGTCVHRYQTIMRHRFHSDILLLALITAGSLAPWIRTVRATHRASIVWGAITESLERRV
jgi:hypothetical protein